VVAATAGKRVYFGPGLRTEAEAFFKSFDAAEAGFELTGTRDWIISLAASNFAGSVRSNVLN
jgi:hypothetical protein